MVCSIELRGSNFKEVLLTKVVLGIAGVELEDLLDSRIYDIQVRVS
jgi:hypothetical protein